MKKSLLFVSVLLLPTLLCASTFSFDFESRDLVLLDSNTGEKIFSKEVVVYRWYDYPCILDGSRPSKCTEGDSQIFNQVNGDIHLVSLKMKKHHLRNLNPRIGIQISNLGTIWMSLDEFNSSSNPLELKFKPRD